MNANEVNKIKRFFSRTNKQMKVSKLIPYDGFAIKSKKLKVADLVNDSIIYHKAIGRNILFDKPFPLLNVVSNRNNLNKSEEFLQKVLTSNRDKHFSQATNNLIKASSLDFYRKSQQSKKNYSRIKEILTSSAQSIIDPIDRTVSYSKTFELTSCQPLGEYNKTAPMNNEIHQYNKNNKEYILNKKRNEFNYALNSYKARDRDLMMNKLITDAILLKFDQRLRLFSEV